MGHAPVSSSHRGYSAIYAPPSHLHNPRWIFFPYRLAGRLLPSIIASISTEVIEVFAKCLVFAWLAVK